MPISVETQRGLEALRDIFVGIATRHDCVRSRIVVAEADYNKFLSGPNDDDWRQTKCIAYHGLTIREPHFDPISDEEAAKLAVERPDVPIVQREDETQKYRAQKGVNSTMPFKGSIAGFAEFRAAAHDAGYFAIQYLREVAVELNVPEMVPLAAVGKVRAVSASTVLPSSLLERWVLFLHILGWQALKRLPLRAERALWHENTRIAGDPEKLASQLEHFRLDPTLMEKIPFPPKYFASTLVQDVSLASTYAVDTLLEGAITAPAIELDSFRKRLEAIKPGRSQASEYHVLVTEILTLVCEPDLRNPVTEDKIHEGRGRIDIVFDNAAEQGYFFDLQFRHNIKCPVVFVECKNYSDDIAGPEFAQLVSRLSTKRSQVGFIVCRKVDDEAHVLKRCKDQFNDRSEHIVVLTDDDLVDLLTAKAKNDKLEVSNIFRAKWRKIFMDK